MITPELVSAELTQPVGTEIPSPQMTLGSQEERGPPEEEVGSDHEDSTLVLLQTSGGLDPYGRQSEEHSDREAGNIASAPESEDLEPEESRESETQTVGQGGQGCNPVGKAMWRETDAPREGSTNGLSSSSSPETEGGDDSQSQGDEPSEEGSGSQETDEPPERGGNGDGGNQGDGGEPNGGDDQNGKSEPCEGKHENPNEKEVNEDEKPEGIEQQGGGVVAN